MSGTAKVDRAAQSGDSKGGAGVLAGVVGVGIDLSGVEGGMGEGWSGVSIGPAEWGIFGGVSFALSGVGSIPVV